MASSPRILYPITDWSVTNNKYYSDSLTQIIQGDVPATVTEIIDGTVTITVEQRYKIVRNGVTIPYTSFSTNGVTVGNSNVATDTVPWSFDSDGVISFQEDDVVTIQFKTVERRRIDNGLSFQLSESTASTVIIEIISEDKIESSIGIPTGVKIKRKEGSIKIMMPSDGVSVGNNATFVGVNYYMSLTAGGGEDGYQLMNDSYINTVDTTETTQEVLTVNSYQNNLEDLTVTTTETRQIDNTYYTFSLTPNVVNTMVTDQKIPNIFLSDGVTLDPNTSYYLVVALVAYDETLSQVIISNYSIELEGKFLEYRVDFIGLPERTRNDVLTSINKRLITNNESVNVISGSVIRDIIDPVTLEFEKFYVIQDFVFKALSIDSLIAFDDADGDGVSDSLQSNLGKLRLADALNFTSATNFQSFIDQQFDKIASNYNITRTGSVAARGSVTFYTSNQFNNDLFIPDGTIVTAPSDPDTGRQGVDFKVVGTYVIEVDNKEYYYNAKQKRYEIDADIEANFAGAQGNVPAGTITLTSGLNPSLEVINSSPTDFGADRESNRDLSNRIKLGIISYDSGTEGGYSATALEVPSVNEVRVEKVGDPLMMRDYDRDSMEHIGGKVDIYLKGDRTVQTTDQVAFKYEYPSDVTGSNVSERFDVINATEYRLRCRNSKISVNSPIVFVSSVRNVTRGQNYDLTDLSIIGEGDTIILINNITNNNIGMATFDVINVSYKYRSSNVLTLDNQPVDEVISIVDSQNNVIDESYYRLIKRDDPLVNGFSDQAKDGVEFLFQSTDDFDEFINVTNEQHDLYYNVNTALNNKGIDISTIRVYDPDDTSTVYIKDTDYTIVTGSDTENTYLTLETGSMIRQGGRVAVDYTAAQNFIVTYTHNSLIDQVAESVDEMRHACADIAVKQAIGNYIDLSFQVVRNPKVNSSRLKSKIQTSLANKVNSLKMGDSLTQGTVVSTVKSVSGVQDVVMPFTKMMKRSGSFISLDEIGQIAFEVYTKTSSFGITSYRSINSVLTYKTQANGGPDNLFRTVYEDNVSLTLVEDASEVHKAAGQAYIQSDGKIIVSTIDGRPPHSKDYKAAYYTYYKNNENIVGDIEAGQTEYLRVDSASLANIEIIDQRVVKRGL